jgi:hypothetical protein
MQKIYQFLLILNNFYCILKPIFTTPNNDFYQFLMKIYCSKSEK